MPQHITFRLMQESGVQGASHTQSDFLGSFADAQEAARGWAASQTGHPWDCLSLEIGGEVFEVTQ